MAETAKTTLKMVFKGTTTSGEEVLRTISLENPRADVTEADITSFMNLCITKKALYLGGTDQPVTGIKEAYKEVTTKTPIIAAVTVAEPVVVSETTKQL